MKGESRIRVLAIVLALLLLAAAAVVLPVTQVFAAAGIWQSYIILDGAYFDVKANTASPDFPSSHLGTFAAGSSSLILSGGEIKTPAPIS